MSAVSGSIAICPIAITRSGTGEDRLFRGDRFLAENGFRADAKLHFVNHHEAHALGALFFTDWDDALIYTADGVGDNVSYSVRALQDGQLDCLFGGDEWLKVEARAAQQPGHRLWPRHEGGRISHVAPRGQAHRPVGARRAQTARCARPRIFALAMTA